VCVEWAQAKARAERWDEEVSLTVEEMRRVLCFLKWREQWWNDQGERRGNARSDIQDGLKAYAAKQARIMGGLAQSFADEWYPLVAGRGISNADWPETLKGKRQVVEGRKDDAVMEGMEEDAHDYDDMFE
jgi:hypothetical protein